MKPPFVSNQGSTPPPARRRAPPPSPRSPRTSFSRPTQRRKQTVSPSPKYKNGKSCAAAQHSKMRIRQWTRAQSNPEPPLGIDRPCRRLALPQPPPPPSPRPPTASCTTALRHRRDARCPHTAALCALIRPVARASAQTKVRGAFNLSAPAASRRASWPHLRKQERIRQRRPPHNAPRGR